VAPPLEVFMSTRKGLQLAFVCLSVLVGCGGAPPGPASDDASAAVDLAPACAPRCAGRHCGDNGCGGSCGPRDEGETCDADGTCQPPCEPSCAGLACGDDGCGGSCGKCDNGTCVGGQCQCANDRGCGAGKVCITDAAGVKQCAPTCDLVDTQSCIA